VVCLAHFFRILGKWEFGPGGGQNQPEKDVYGFISQMVRLYEVTDVFAKRPCGHNAQQYTQPEV
jgi:hypothetical protein